MAEDVQKVAIIGAVLSGILVMHHLQQSSTRFYIKTFEQNYDVGGLWLYTDETKVNECGLPVHSAMYNDFR